MKEAELFVEKRLGETFEEMPIFRTTLPPKTMEIVRKLLEASFEAGFISAIKTLTEKVNEK